MKQLLVLSGKGGTGKTTVASSLIMLASAKGYADCDVDAPNLHLLNKMKAEPIRTPYYGMDKASVVETRCTGCGACMDLCRFDAIQINESGKAVVDNLACEGCKVCMKVCPENAIEMNRVQAGELRLTDQETVFSSAKLFMGNGTSGLLVTEVKRKLALYKDRIPFAVIDGSPGIGCPVISSISGVDFVLIVTEPSESGISDMSRLIEAIKRFKAKAAVCINRYDTNIEMTRKIEMFCKSHDLPIVGRIPYDDMAVKAINDGKTVIEVDSSAGRAIFMIYENLKKFIQSEETLFEIV